MKIAVEKVVTAHDGATGDPKAVSLVPSNGNHPTLPALILEGKGMEGQMRVSTASIRTIRDAAVVVRRHSETENKQTDTENTSSKDSSLD